MHGECWQELSPALWKGHGDPEQYQSRTRRQCAVRLYSYGDKPMVLGQTAIINDGEFLELPYLNFCETSRFNAPENITLVEEFGDEAVTLNMPSDRLHIAGACAVLVQQGEGVWGHWLVDVLPRIKMVRELLPDVVIAISEGPAWALDLLRHAGIDLGRVVRYEPRRTVLTADRIFMPSFVRFANGFSPLAANVFRSRARAEENRNRKLYVTRSVTRFGSTVLNNCEIESLFVRRGFEVVSPERLTVAQQVALFAQARQLVGEYGSGMHNSIFSGPGTRVLSLQSESVNQFVQAGIGGVLGQPTGFVFGQCKPAERSDVRMAASLRRRLCWIDPALVEQALVEFLQH